MRFTEDINTNVSQDFLPRRYFTPLRQVIPFYIVSLILVIGTIQSEELFGSTITTLLAFVVLTAASAFVFFKLQQSNDLAMANDFQNLLFAGAASIGSSFCFFVRRDGTIVYSNDSTRKMFPKFSRSQQQALELLLEEAQVSKENINKLYSAITRGKKETQVFTMRGADSPPQDFIIIIEPLKRPSGYYVVHGRPYTKERSAQVKMPGILGNTSLEKVEVLLDQLPIGVYLTNETGVIEYANPALEDLARYGHRRIVSESITVQQLIYHADGKETGEFELTDFTGNVLLSCLNRSLSRAFLEQKKIALSTTNKPGGFLGIVTPMS